MRIVRSLPDVHEAHGGSLPVPLYLVGGFAFPFMINNLLNSVVRPSLPLSRPSSSFPPFVSYPLFLLPTACQTGSTHRHVNHSQGFPWTIRIWALFTCLAYTLALSTLRPRLPVVRPTRGEARGGFARVDLKVLRNPVVLVMVRPSPREVWGLPVG